ncbi:MAG: TetR/AcrR family transcriptional regulator [Bdellovibrionales bacterium]|nr:TetR/AcrR family transcriptional regulator [Bdellovibrionales bacterium]
MTSPKHGEPDTPQLLLKAARKVFARKGFPAATVKEIADEAGVNISLISYHFNGKEGIYRACLREFGEQRLSAAKRILTPPESEGDMRAKLKLLGHDFFQTHVDCPEVCAMMHQDSATNLSLVRDLYDGFFMKFFETLIEFLASAKKKKFVRPDLEPLHAAGFYFGAIVHVGRSSLILKEFYNLSLDNQKYREKLVDDFVDYFLNGIRGGRNA